MTGEDREKILSPESKEKLAGLRKEAKELGSKLPPEPEMTCAVEEGGENVPLPAGKVLVRGDYNIPGEDVSKGFPLILGGDQQPAIVKGSGRLELANWLTQPDHPLGPHASIE